ncbi:hypothetical protein FACS189434_09560 [Bacteroidia bacterium]|nr:hypothetical protein FACS189434_09560 [Bacteroidia bacterium]
MIKILLLLGKKKRLRLYDILSIVSISIYASKISNEKIAFNLMDIDILKTIIYCVLAVCIYLFYSVYQDYRSIHDEVNESVKSGTEKSYDDIYNETIEKSDYKNWLYIKLGLFVFSIIIIIVVGYLWHKSL